MNFLNKVLEHCLGNFEVRNDTILEGSNSHNVPRCFTEHFLGLFADGNDLLASLGISMNCYD